MLDDDIFSAPPRRITTATIAAKASIPTPTPTSGSNTSVKPEGGGVGDAELEAVLREFDDLIDNS